MKLSYVLHSKILSLKFYNYILSIIINVATLAKGLFNFTAKVELLQPMKPYNFHYNTHMFKETEL